MNNPSFVSVAPGRLCLFGEHQDYLGLPVIALSLPLYCRIRVTPDPDSRILTLHVPQLKDGDDDKELVIKYDLDNLPPRQQGSQHTTTEKPDFALTAIHEALDEGWIFTSGAKCVSTTDIVMQAGCSSSSAFCVAWIQVLARLANRPTLSPVELAVRAHRAEVVHFGAPGGTMDHVTSAVGGLLRIGPGQWQYESLVNASDNDDEEWPTEDLGVWVVAYSGEPKDTMKHLKRCKTARLELLNGKLGGSWDAEPSADLDETERILLEATRTTRDMERKATELWKSQTPPQDTTDNEDNNRPTTTPLGQRLGALMTTHHEALRDGLGLSTPRIEALKNAALDAGAWGFKLVGSGGGGCVAAWTSQAMASAVSEAMIKEGGAPSTWIVRQPSPRASVTIIEES